MVITNYYFALTSIKKITIFVTHLPHAATKNSIMKVSCSATTVYRHSNNAYTACLRMRIGIIVIFCSLLIVGNRNIGVECKVEAIEFRAFADFLKQQHLKHAIVAYNGETSKLLQQQYEQHLVEDNALRALVNFTRLHFYDVHHATKSKKTKNFKNLFFYGTPRVGIYLNELEDILLQKYVLEANSESSAVSCALPDENCVDGSAFLRFNNSQAWFIMSKALREEVALSNIKDVMTSLPINISADITFGVRVGDNTTIKLFDIYKIQHDLLEIEEKGYWSADKGLRLKKRFYQSFVKRRRDLKGLQLRAGMVIRERPDGISDLDYMNSLDYKKSDSMQRQTYQMLMMLEPMFNLSFQTNIKDDWGKSWPNGSWTGVMELLISGEAELSLYPMHLEGNRLQLLHYSPALHSEYVFFLFRHPLRNEIRNIFIEPFVQEVWYTVFALIVLTTLLLLLHLYHEQRFFLNKDPHFQYRIDYAFLSILEAFFMQGPDNNAFSATSTRALIFFVCVLSLLLQQFYGAYIVGSILAVSPRTITNLKALYNSSLEIGIENIPYNIEFFENSSSSLVQALYTQRICQNRKRHVISVEEGAERIKKGGYAFHASGRMYYVLKDILKDKEFCDLQEVSFVPPLQISIGIGKLSPFYEYLSTSILTLRSTGIVQHSDRKWKVPKLDCSLSQNREVEVDLQHFQPALLLLCSGMLLSVSILILEIIYYNLEHGLKLAKFFPNLVAQLKTEYID
ncbi:probable glutamate receptor [Eurosta solidaginis]|uniref:probable glutamate receptor n=1 Tax=Eurosta solidaginis TaxID=178769 RepID=UPI003530AAA6